jgi:archaeal flagellar protein FlaI
MGLFEKRACFAHEVIHEGDDKVLRIDCHSCSFSPSLEDSELCMAKTIEILAQIPDVTRLVFVQEKNYEYDLRQTQLLSNLAALYKRLSEDKRLRFSTVVIHSGCERYLRTSYATLQRIIFTTLKHDPVTAYIQLKRLLRSEKIGEEYLIEKQSLKCTRYFTQLVDWIITDFEKTQIIQQTKPLLAGYKTGDRSIYRRLFHPIIRPDFMFAKLMASYPMDGEVLDSYSIGDTEITIFGFPDDVKTLYHVVPPEFKFSEEKYEILDSARRIMAEHKPTKAEFVDPDRMRDVFLNVGKDLIKDLTTTKEIDLEEKEIDELAEVLLRYTVGFGLIEVLLSDPKIQDLSINSPMGEAPIFLVHQEFDDCETNIIATPGEAESWATKLRLISGRPLDEANPILDTEIKLGTVASRVAAVTQPLNPNGLAFSFRRHRDKPWTLPLFMHAGMLNAEAAGLLSFLIDGTRTMLVAGTRSSGKTSLLGSLLVEIMRRYRIITIEDTLELPTTAMRKLGYNIQPLKVASALAGKETSEVSATRGIRSTLRLGDSALIIGEVRSSEAIALYEAMRVGAAANVVAGTIHAASPYGVYDRVVNDIGVPRTSFKATDIIVLSNPVKTAAGLKKKRRVLQITEVRKRWEKDPLREGGFVDLMVYDPKKDELEVTDELRNGDSEVLKDIASRVKEYAGNWDAVWENIQARAAAKKMLVELAQKTKNMDMLEAPFVAHSNDMFHAIVDKVRQDVGGLDTKRVMFQYSEWLKRYMKTKSTPLYGQRL